MQLYVLDELYVEKLTAKAQKTQKLNNNSLAVNRRVVHTADPTQHPL